MLDIIESADSTDCLVPGLPAETPESHNRLGDQIAGLWSAHLSAKKTARATTAELRNIRAKLGEQLSEMKKLLVRPGCDGQWSGFLRERQIPRATADRLVARHQRSLNPDANRLSEAVSEEEIQKLFTCVWPKLRRTLRSRESLAVFIELLTSHCQPSEATVHELPVTMAAKVTFGPACLDGDSFVEPEFAAAALVARAEEQII